MLTIPFLNKPNKDYPESIDNHGILNELKTVEERLSGEEASDYIAPLDSRESLQQLEVERDKLSAIVASIGSASLIVGLTTFSIALIGLLLAWKPTTRLEKVARLIKLITAILEEFERIGVETLPLIKVPGFQPIDLFVRFPGKEFLIFAIRSFGDSSIVFNERRQALFYKRTKKGLQQWEPDPLLELSEQVFWLRKNQRNLFGSSRGVRKPMAKVLVLWGETRLDEHQEHLYATLDGKKFLFIPREGGACYVIHQSQVIEFVRAWLAHRQSQQDQAA